MYNCCNAFLEVYNRVRSGYFYIYTNNYKICYISLFCKTRLSRNIDELIAVLIHFVDFRKVHIYFIGFQNSSSPLRRVSEQFRSIRRISDSSDPFKTGFRTVQIHFYGFRTVQIHLDRFPNSSDPFRQVSEQFRSI